MYFVLCSLSKRLNSASDFRRMLTENETNALILTQQVNEDSRGVLQAVRIVNEYLSFVSCYTWRKQSEEKRISRYRTIKSK